MATLVTAVVPRSAPLHWGPLGGIKLAHSCLLGGVKADSVVRQDTIAFIDSLDPSSFLHKVTGNTIVRHSGSMVGSDFKYLGQIAPYIAQFLAPRCGWNLVKPLAVPSTLDPINSSTMPLASPLFHWLNYYFCQARPLYMLQPSHQ